MLLLGFLAIALCFALGLRADDAEVEATTPTVTTAPKPVILKILFPEGFTRKEMAQRVADVRPDRQDQAERDAEALRQRVRSRVEGPRRYRRHSDKHARGIEGFLFPATYEFTAKTTSKQLVDDQIEHFNDNWAKVDQRYAQTKKLTPYDVLIIASMVEKETSRARRAPARRSRDLQPAASADAARDRRDDPLRAGRSAAPSRCASRNSTATTRTTPGTAPACRRPRSRIPGLASMQAAAHPAKVKYLYFVRKPDQVHHFFTASESEFFAKACEYGYG